METRSAGMGKGGKMLDFSVISHAIPAISHLVDAATAEKAVVDRSSPRRIGTLKTMETRSAGMGKGDAPSWRAGWAQLVATAISRGGAARQGDRESGHESTGRKKEKQPENLHFTVISHEIPVISHFVAVATASRRRGIH